MDNKYKTIIEDGDYSYEIEIYGKTFLNIDIKQKSKNNEKYPPKKYKNKIITVEDLKLVDYNYFYEDFQKLKSFSKIIELLKSKDAIIKIEEDDFDLNLTIEFKKPIDSYISINIEQLNIEYYLTTGKNHKRINVNPFYASLNDDFFNINKLKEILIEEKIINEYKIDSYRYYDEDKKGFIKLNELKDYKTPNNKLILELHSKKIFDSIIPEIGNMDNNLSNKIKKVKNEIKNNIKYLQKTKKYDLIYLYASPIIGKKGGDIYKPINYHDEIKTITKIFNKSQKSFNCLFECANEKLFKNILMEKQIKILHIASHGDLEESNNKYFLILENNLKQQSIYYDKLENILKANSSNIKNIDLVFVSTCHSEGLGKLFKKYGAKNVIYITGMTPISNIAALKFSEFFYQELVNQNSIKESFYKVQEKIKTDREVIYNNKNDCCCNHKHDKKCLIKEENNKRYHIHKDFHKEKCCYFSEFHMHKLNCNFYKKIKEKIRELEEKKKKGEIINEDEDVKFSIKEFKESNYVKICCCNHDIKHSEASKFTLISNEDTKPFKLQEKGKLEINENCVFDFDHIKDFSVIGRAKHMETILKILTDNSGYYSHFIIVYGDKDMGKQEFAESACVYLFERKIIKFYEIINISTEYDFEYIKNKLLNYNKNLQDKIIIILKINYLLDEEKTFYFAGQILNKIIIENNNLYFIILLTTKKENIELDLQGKNKLETIDIKLTFKFAKELLLKLCFYLGFQNNYNSIFNNIYDEDYLGLMKLIQYKPKKIKQIADLIGEIDNFEQLKKNIISEDLDEIKRINEIEKLMENMNISKIYYLLSIMPSGLPESLLKLIYPNYEEFMKEEDVTKTLIYTDPNDNWKYIKEYKRNITNFFYCKEKDQIRQECISNCLKVYAKLLFYYIEKNRQKICFPDNNIHYLFNSYNDTGIWKTFDLPIYNYCFYFENDKNIYDNILKDKFILERHENNITNLILNNLDDLQKLIKDDIIKEYLEQITLKLPTCYFLEKECIIIIKKYIYICDQLKLENSKKRLLLFLYSIDKIQQIDIKEFNDSQYGLEIDAYFLNALKKEDITLFKELIQKYKDINVTSNGETNTVENSSLKKILIYAYYEIAGLYYSKKIYQDALSNLILAKELSKEINNCYLLDRINIDIVLVKMKNFQMLKRKIILSNEKEKEKIISDMDKEYLDDANKLLNEVIHQKPYNKKLKLSLTNEAYKLMLDLNKKLENDIVILNSNPLKGNYSALNNGIFSYLNNQYYLLRQLQEKIKMRLKIESKLLNIDNLNESFNQNGKILIIQSDDFTENGEIVYETKYGESQVLSIEDLKKILPEKIKYNIVILCFIKSGKLKKLFEDKVEYLITFDDFDYFKLNNDDLYKYNKLSIEFLINFIEKTTYLKNIKHIFEESKKLFIDEFKNCKTIENCISLTNKNNLINYIKYENNNQEKIFLNQPLINIPSHTPIKKDYVDEIFKIIKIILSGEHQFINVYLNQDDKIKENNSKKINKKSLIGIEIMKFLYRHQSFDKLYYIYNPQKYGKSLKEIINNVLENESEGETIGSSYDSLTKFILINDYTKIKNKDKELYKENEVIYEEPLTLMDNVQYLIMTKKEIIIDNNDKFKTKDKDIKKSVIMKNTDFDIYKINLEDSVKLEGSKKIKKLKTNKDDNKTITDIGENNINIEDSKIDTNSINIFEDNKKIVNEKCIFKDFNSIFDYSFESDKTISSCDESDDDQLF